MMTNIPQIIIVGNSALTEKKINESSRTHSCVRIRIRDDSIDESQNEHFRHWILSNP